MIELIRNVCRYTIQVCYNNKTWVSTCFSFSSLKETRKMIKRMKANVGFGNSHRIVKKTVREEVVE